MTVASPGVGPSAYQPADTRETVAPSGFVFEGKLGGSGVYKAVHVESGVRMLVEKLNVQSETDRPGEELSDPFLEMDSLRTLRHAHVSEVFGVYRDPNFGYFLTSEWLSHGFTLRDYIDRAPHLLTLEVVKTIAAQTVAGLGALHQANIVHGDIRPESLVLIPRSAERAQALHQLNAKAGSHSWLCLPRLCGKSAAGAAVSQHPSNEGGPSSHLPVLDGRFLQVKISGVGVCRDHAVRPYARVTGCLSYLAPELVAHLKQGVDWAINERVYREPSLGAGEARTDLFQSFCSADVYALGMTVLEAYNPDLFNSFPTGDALMSSIVDPYLLRFLGHATAAQPKERATVADLRCVLPLPQTRDRQTDAEADADTAGRTTQWLYKKKLVYEEKEVVDVLEGLSLDLFAAGVLLRYPTSASRRQLMRDTLVIVRSVFKQSTNILNTKDFEQFVKRELHLSDAELALKRAEIDELFLDSDIVKDKRPSSGKPGGGTPEGSPTSLMSVSQNSNGLIFRPDGVLMPLQQFAPEAVLLPPPEDTGEWRLDLAEESRRRRTKSVGSGLADCEFILASALVPPQPGTEDADGLSLPPQPGLSHLRHKSAPAAIETGDADRKKRMRGKRGGKKVREREEAKLRKTSNGPDTPGMLVSPSSSSGSGGLASASASGSASGSGSVVSAKTEKAKRVSFAAGDEEVFYYKNQ